MRQRTINLLLGVLAVTLLTSCTHAGVGRGLSEAESSRAPALGTAWGRATG
jgi:predicted small secreted protein